MFKTISDRIMKEQKQVTADATTMYSMTKFGIIGTVFGSLMGLFSGFPLEAISGLALAGGCIQGNVNAELNANYKSTRLSYEANNLNKLGKSKIDTSAVAMSKRKNKLNILGKKLETKRTEKNIAKAINTFLNLGLIAASVVGMTIPGPLSILPMGITILKHFQNKSLNLKIHDYEAVLSQYHQLEDEQKIAQDLNNKQNNYNQKVQAKKMEQEKTYAKQKETTRKPSNNYNNLFYTGYANENNKGAYQKVRA